MEEQDASQFEKNPNLHQLSEKQRQELRNKMSTENSAIARDQKIPRDQKKQTSRDRGILAVLQKSRFELLRGAFGKAKEYQESVKQFVKTIKPTFLEDQRRRWIKNKDKEEQTNAEKNIEAALSGIEENTDTGELETAVTMRQDLKDYTEEPIRFYTQIQSEHGLITDNKNYSPRQNAIDSQLQKLRNEMLRGNLQEAYDKKDEIQEFIQEFKEGYTNNIRDRYVHNDVPKHRGRREKQMSGIANQIDQSLTKGNIDHARKQKKHFEGIIGMYKRYTKSLEKKYLKDILKKKQRTAVETQVLEAVATIESKLRIGRLDEIDTYIKDLEDYLKIIRAEEKKKKETKNQKQEIPPKERKNIPKQETLQTKEKSQEELNSEYKQLMSQAVQRVEKAITNHKKILREHNKEFEVNMTPDGYPLSTLLQLPNEKLKIIRKLGHSVETVDFTDAQHAQHLEDIIDLQNLFTEIEEINSQIQEKTDKNHKKNKQERKELTPERKALMGGYLSGNFDAETVNDILNNPESPIGVSILSRYSIDALTFRDTIMHMVDESMIPLNELKKLVEDVDDREFVMSVVKRSPDVLTVQKKFENKKGKLQQTEAKFIIPEHFLNDLELIKVGVLKGANIINNVKPEIKAALIKDKEVATSILQTSGAYIEMLPDFQDDEKMIDLALDNYNAAIKYASPRLQDNFDLIKKSITKRGIQNDAFVGKNLKFASARLKGAEKDSWPEVKKLARIAYKENPDTYKLLDPMFSEADENQEFMHEINKTTSTTEQKNINTKKLQSVKSTQITNTKTWRDQIKSNLNVKKETTNTSSNIETQKTIIDIIDLGMDTDSSKILLNNKRFLNKLEKKAQTSKVDIRELFEKKPNLVMETIQSEIDTLQKEKPSKFNVLKRRLRKQIIQQIALLHEFTNQVVISKTANVTARLDRTRDRGRRHDKITKSTGSTSMT